MSIVKKYIIKNLNSTEILSAQQLEKKSSDGFPDYM